MTRIYRCEYRDDAADFWREAEALLMAQESLHNLSIGLTLAMASAERVYDEAWFVLVREGDRIVGAALQTADSRPVVLSAMPLDAARTLASEVLSRPQRAKQFCAEASVAAAFAERWQAATGDAPSVHMRQGVYELRELSMPDAEGGRLVCAGVAEESSVRRMMRGFVQDALSEDPTQGDAIAERLLPAGHVYLWQSAEGELVSMAARNRETPTTACLSMVYTPPEHRRHGYAGRVVAGATKIWLDRGKRAINLYTDLANDTSNSVYRRLGYVQLAESHIYDT